MYTTPLVLGLLSQLQAHVAHAAPANPSPCPPLKGDLTVAVTDLYPESADWDSIHCKIYFNSINNVTTVVYDPYAKTYTKLTLPDGLNGNKDHHADGVDFDARSGSVYLSSGSSSAFDTDATGTFTFANLTGPNNVLRYDTNAKKFVYNVDLASVQAEFAARTGSKNVTAFQDTAEDTAGNAYAISAFGNAIAKITPAGKASLWYAPPKADVKPTYGFGGIIALGDTLVVADTISRDFLVFDAKAAQGTPKFVAPTNVPANYSSVPIFPDALYAPAKYGGKVALVADDDNGVIVYGSKDTWSSAKFLGQLTPTQLALGDGKVSAIFAAGNTIYANIEFFVDPTAIPRRDTFPVLDITDRVDAFVKAGGFE